MPSDADRTQSEDSGQPSDGGGHTPAAWRCEIRFTYAVTPWKEQITDHTPKDSDKLEYRNVEPLYAESDLRVLVEDWLEEDGGWKVQAAKELERFLEGDDD